MQSNPRIVVNLLVMLVKTLVNLPVKLTKLGIGGGAMGGPTPSTRASPRCCCPRKDYGGVYGETMRLMRLMETTGGK